jgi:hypothetical protein
VLSPAEREIVFSREEIFSIKERTERANYTIVAYPAFVDVVTLAE